jgi:2-desacetyl-2-hydroxyethyl bacteriochlorophyllide A dehydrogenase
MGHLVRFSAPNKAEIVDVDDPTAGAGEVVVETLYSGISAGTELTGYRGSNPYATRTWQPDERLFMAGQSEDFYPKDAWGYEEVGRVAAVGAGADPALVGKLVWGTWGHRSSVALPAAHVSERILPADTRPVTGIFSEIGAIALNAILDADIHVGETVVVFGAGVPGQIVAQLARLNGARVVVVDLVASRRELAKRLGASTVLDPVADDVAACVRQLTDNRGADVVIEMSGSYFALHEATRTAAYSSRVVVAGFFQGPATPVRLGEEFHHNRIALIGSQISGVEPGLSHRWDKLRMSRTVFELERTGRLRLADLITHTMPAREAPAAFSMLDTAPEEALQVVLDYGVDSGDDSGGAH